MCQNRGRFVLSWGRPGGLLGSRLLRCAGGPDRRWCRATAPFALGGLFSAAAGIAAGPRELVAACPCALGPIPRGQWGCGAPLVQLLCKLLVWWSQVCDLEDAFKDW
ncbi:hypothetical protein NDU88_006364 [Pleurodeles waltl]|uniref:Uncharacterized protein n=1 Tax=Pleurodeles waltl TaxID=8319 RepID=A0AAV7RRV3_PLEWA|nr:hypothetical protein NDU88_006364 [Pleurodeles waltl]